MISVVITFRNEEDCLKELITRLENVLTRIQQKYEIIFVDDYSTDNSNKILIEERLKNNQIKIIKTSKNIGNGRSLVYGLSKSRGDYIVYLDCDLQDPPELIEDMYKLIIDKKIDIINTQRISREGETITKKFVTNVAYKVVNVFNKDKILEDSGDFKMLSRNALNAILLYKDNDPFTRGFPVLVGFKQMTLKYNRDKRNFGNTHYSLLSSTNPYKELIRGIVFNSFRPIYLIFFLGIFFFFITFFYLIFFEFNFESFLILFFLSILQLSIGFLGLYIKRILDKNYQNPSAFIEYEVGFEKNENW